jgi:thymidylate kinase
MLITFEGLPGAGKSTQAALLADCLHQHGRAVTTVPDLATLPTQPVATTIINLLAGYGDPYLRTGDAVTDTLLTAAIRADLVATILTPTLQTDPNTIVIEDRGLHTLASYAIASLLREHRSSPAVALDWLDALTALTEQPPEPRLALWLRLPPSLAAQRAAHRTDAPVASATRPEHAAYLHGVDLAYRLLADHDPQHLVVVDVSTLDSTRAHQAIHQALTTHLDEARFASCASLHAPAGGLS